MKQLPSILLGITILLLGVQSACDMTGSCSGEECSNGTWNEDNCECICSDGWEGTNCDKRELPNVISSEIAYQSTKQTYSTDDMHVRFVRNPGGLDTVIIDSEVSPNNWLYVFLADRNISRIENKKFPVVGNVTAGTAWVQHYNQSQTEDHFVPDALQTSGELIIDALDFDRQFIRIRFNANLKTPPETAVCTSGVINYVN